MDSELVILLAMSAGGAAVGLLSRWAPLSGWAALGFSLLLVPLGMGATLLWC